MASTLAVILAWLSPSVRRSLRTAVRLDAPLRNRILTGAEERGCLVIERIDEVSDLGLFTNYKHNVGSDFRDVTLVFGENGVGKTTIAALLDSARAGDADSMLRRARLAATKAPAAEVTIDGRVYRFDGTAWDDRPPDDTLDVYFSDFVSRNVYSGEKVDSDHRRQLCEFALGPRALESMEKLRKATEASGAALKEAQRIEALLKRLVKEPHTIVEFEALERREDVLDRLKAAERQLAAAKRVGEELNREAPSEVALPAIPRDDVTSFLAMSTDEIADDAVARVRQHISLRLDKEEGEEWLSYGAAHLTDRCPFCAQPTAGVSLVEAIAAFYGDAYREYVASVKEAAESLKASIGTAAIDPVVADLTKQIAIAGKWADQYTIDTSKLAESVDLAATNWRQAAKELGQSVSKKLSAPLDSLSESEASEALRLYEEAVSVFAEVNGDLAGSHKAVEAYKKVLAKADTEKLQLEVNKLQNEIARSEQYALGLLSSWNKAKGERAKQEERRTTLKAEFEDHATRVVGSYQKAINYYLAAFGCEMEIKEVKPAFPAGKASVTYELHVRGYSVPLGYCVDKPCFQTTLSEGDRCSLGLAFFLARLKDHKTLDGRTVILDDPVDSFGTLRLRAVRLAIRDLCARGAQVMVLTHDERLAAMIWRDSARHAMSKKSFTALEMVETKSGALLRIWDVERATRGQYFNDYAALEDFLDDKLEHTAAMRSIRPYAEQRLRYRFPGTGLSSRDNLGDIIGKIKNASKGSRLKELEPKLRDLEELNDASLPSHHASDDAPDMPLPGRKETRRYAELAMSVC